MINLSVQAVVERVFHEYAEEWLKQDVLECGNCHSYVTRAEEVAKETLVQRGMPSFYCINCVPIHP